MPTKDELIVAAKAAALAYSLDAAIVCGIVERETSWNPWAIRYEPDFFTRYVSPLYSVGKLSLTDAMARSFSWGLMQVMGQVAREVGFAGPLPQLCEPSVGLDIGCQVYAHKLLLKQGSVTGALLAWNGGGNPNYAAEVLKFAESFKGRV